MRSGTTHNDNAVGDFLSRCRVVSVLARRRDRSTSTQEIGCVRGANSGRPYSPRHSSIGPRQSVRAAVSYRSPLRQQTTWSNLFSTARAVRSTSGAAATKQTISGPVQFNIPKDKPFLPPPPPPSRFIYLRQLYSYAAPRVLPNRPVSLDFRFYFFFSSFFFFFLGPRHFSSDWFPLWLSSLFRWYQVFFVFFSFLVFIVFNVYITSGHLMRMTMADRTSFRTHPTPRLTFLSFRAIDLL